MSAQQLSDGCESAGYPIPRSTIANLESGRKETVSLQEVLVIAQVLELPPITLIYSPWDVAETVQVVPGVDLLGVDASDRFTYSGPDVSVWGNLNYDALVLRDLEQRASLLFVRNKFLRSGDVEPAAAGGGRLDDESVAELAEQEAESNTRSAVALLRKARPLREGLVKAGVRVWELPAGLIDAYAQAESGG